MSVVLNILLLHPLPLADMAIAIGQIIEINWLRIEDDLGIRYQGAALGCGLCLYDDHGLEDDLGIPFSKYNYHLGLRLDCACDPPDRVEEYRIALARRVFSRLTRRLRCPGLLVYDLQEILEEASGEVRSPG